MLGESVYVAEPMTGCRSLVIKSQARLGEVAYFA